jgi:hypothetical protein
MRDFTPSYLTKKKKGKWFSVLRLIYRFRIIKASTAPTMIMTIMMAMIPGKRYWSVVDVPGPDVAVGVAAASDTEMAVCANEL